MTRGEKKLAASAALGGGAYYLAGMAGYVEGARAALSGLEIDGEVARILLTALAAVLPQLADLIFPGLGRIVALILKAFIPKQQSQRDALASIKRDVAADPEACKACDLLAARLFAQETEVTDDGQT